MSDPLETAWRIHEAQVDWTGKVDAKANFALAIESAALVAIMSASREGALAMLDGPWALSCYRVGVVLVVLAILLGASVVMPQLRGRKTIEESRTSFVYFGHARHWDPDKLRARLTTVDMLPVLSRQIVVTSKIAWRKHRLVQASMVCAMLGMSLVGVAGLLAAWVC